MPAVVLFFSGEIVISNIVGAASAANESNF